MEFEIEVRIELKKGVMDAEGETVEKSLKLLGYNVKKVESVKVYNITVDAKSKKDAIRQMDDACKRLLANPVIHNYSIRVV